MLLIYLNGLGVAPPQKGRALSFEQAMRSNIRSEPSGPSARSVERLEESSWTAVRRRRPIRCVSEVSAHRPSYVWPMAWQRAPSPLSDECPFGRRHVPSLNHCVGTSESPPLADGSHVDGHAHGRRSGDCANRRCWRPPFKLDGPGAVVDLIAAVLEPPRAPGVVL